jgi:hypothetical protein
MTNGAEARFLVGPVTRSNRGDVYRCNDGLDGSSASSDPLNVQYKPEFGGLQNSFMANVTNVIMVTFSVDANPPPTRPKLTRVGNITEVADSRIMISNTSITFSRIRCNHSGNYSILSTNAIGNRSATFSMSVSRSVPMLKSIPLSVKKEQAPSGIADQVVACPDDRITITCSVPGRGLIQRVIVDGQDFLWKRSDFVDDSLTSGTIVIRCWGTNFNTGPSIPFTVTYGKYVCL